MGMMEGNPQPSVQTRQMSPICHPIALRSLDPEAWPFFLLSLFYPIVDHHCRRVPAFSRSSAR